MSRECYAVGATTKMDMHSSLAGVSSAVELTKAGEPPPMITKPALELLTASEAAWQTSVLVSASTVLAIAASIHYSMFLGAAVAVVLAPVLGIAGATGLLIWCGYGRHLALGCFRATVACDDTRAIRVALLLAQFAGVSPEELASTQALRVAIQKQLKRVSTQQQRRAAPVHMATAPTSRMVEQLQTMRGSAAAAAPALATATAALASTASALEGSAVPVGAAGASAGRGLVGQALGKNHCSPGGDGASRGHVQASAAHLQRRSSVPVGLGSGPRPAGAAGRPLQRPLQRCSGR
eukprot:TRINITY_DN40684_c0_g1_i1.p1 TRINITY_DN40684_c0_g1~~TRINITY_DN40684_c0_g1_i1.p1  ORF type:complete len:309 (+),score=48.95 TRINITY_DN40684_c0_g1_i1:48-929(+)